MKRSHSKLLRDSAASKQDRAALLSSMTAILRPELLLEILSFLPTRDVVQIPSVCKGFQSLVESHDEILFAKRLETDFSEGGLLVRSMKEYYSERNQNSGEKICKASFKKMYLAFSNRWVASKNKVYRTDADTVSNPQDVPNQPLIRGNDEKALVFIARVFDHPDSCCLLKWETDDYNEDADKLVPSTALKFPPLAPSLRRFLTGLVANPNTLVGRCLWGNGVPEGDEDYLPYMYTMTLHAIDLERFRVITLVERMFPKMASCVRRLSFLGWPSELYAFSPSLFFFMPSCEEIGNGSNDTNVMGQDTIKIIFWGNKRRTGFHKRIDACRFLRYFMKEECIY